MPDLTFYGASDDLVEVDGVVRDEFPAPMDTELVDLLVRCPDGRAAKVRVAYVAPGVWSVAYAPTDEGAEAPAGRVEVEGYTAKLTLDVPEGTSVHRLAEVT